MLHWVAKTQQKCGIFCLLRFYFYNVTVRALTFLAVLLSKTDLAFVWEEKKRNNLDKHNTAHCIYLRKE